MDPLAALLLLLLWPCHVSTGPSLPVLSSNSEVEKFTLNEGDEEGVSLAVAALTKNDPSPVMLGKMESKISFFDDEGESGKRYSGGVGSLPGDCGRNPISERTGGANDNGPWFLLMGVQNGQGFQMKCIGVVISRLHVLADLLCLQVTQTNVALAPRMNDVVTVGFVSTNGLYDARRPEQLVLGRNIAVVTLSSPLEFSDRLQPACLPPASEVNPNGRMRATVYGVSGDLQKYKFATDVYGPAVILRAIQSYNAENPGRQIQSYKAVSRTHLAVAIELDKVVMSALFYRSGPRGRFTVLGLGPVSAAQDPVSLYTAVSPFRNWISSFVRR